jgi:hypothetical protein
LLQQSKQRQLAGLKLRSPVLYPPCTMHTLYSVHSVFYPPCTMSTLYSTQPVFYPPCTLSTLYSTHPVLCQPLFCPICTLSTLYSTHPTLCPPCTQPTLLLCSHCTLIFPLILKTERHYFSKQLQPVFNGGAKSALKVEN